MPTKPESNSPCRARSRSCRALNAPRRRIRTTPSSKRRMISASGSTTPCTFPEPMSAFDMVTAEAARIVPWAPRTRACTACRRPWASTIGSSMAGVYIGGNASHRSEAEIARRLEEFKQRAFYYYANWGRLYDQWREKMMALISQAQARNAQTAVAGPSSRSPNVHAGIGGRLQPSVAGHLPEEDPRRLLPDLPPPLRVPAAWLRGVPDVLRFLQEGVSGNHRPDHCTHGGGHRGGDLPSRR